MTNPRNLAALSSFKQPTTLSVARTVTSKLRDVISVKDFGAVGDGLTDDTAAVQAALDYAAGPWPPNEAVNQVQIYFPRGSYRLNSPVTAPAAPGYFITGDGSTSSFIYYAHSGACALDFSQTQALGRIGFKDIAIREYGNQNPDQVLKIQNWDYVYIENLTMIGGGRECLSILDTGLMAVTGLDVSAYTGTPLRMRSVAGTITNFQVRKAFSLTQAGKFGACVYLTGVTTSLEVSNGSFGGCGYVDDVTVSSITSSPTEFVVQTGSNHKFRAGDLVVIFGSNVTGYNKTWKVNSVTSNSITVLSTANLGTASAEGVARAKACLFMDTSEGSVNECTWSNILFEGVIPTNTETGGVSVLMYGGSGTVPAVLDAHKFVGCFYDMGQTSIRIEGRVGVNPSNPLDQFVNIRGVQFLGGNLRCAKYGAYLRACRLITLQGLEFVAFSVVSEDPAELADSTSIWIDQTESFGEVRDVSIVGCIAQGYSYDNLLSSYANKYALKITGADHQDIVVTDNILHGNIDTIQFSNWPQPTSRAVIKNNLCSKGLTINSSSVLPVVASASVIDPGIYDTIRVSGNTQVNTIIRNWLGRDLKILSDNGFTTGTSGNIAQAATLSANTVTTMVFSGTKWFNS